jgi:hypothetical protein
MSLLVVSWVSVPSFAQPAAPLPAAASAPRPESQPWKELLDREQPLPDWEPEPVRSWYGWQTLLVDGLSIGVAVLSAAWTDDLDAMWFGVGMLMIGTPIVHFAHQNVSNGFGSLAIRLASGGVFALGYVLDQNTDREGFLWFWLGILGGATAVAVDAAVFAWDEEPRAQQPNAWLTPWLDLLHGRIGVAYASSF